MTFLTQKAQSLGSDPPSKGTVAVILRCYNSEARIEATLSHLFSQDIDHLRILLVDNGSTDDTVAVAGATQARLNRRHFEFDIVREPTPGLAHARRAGVSATSEDVIIFCDDDNWLDANYASTARDLMATTPKAGIFGAAISPAFEVEAPYWFYSHGANFAVGAQALEDGNISSRGYIWGAGLVVRGEVLRSVYSSGIEHLCIGRTQNNLLSGDDAELSKWILLLGWELHASSALHLTHFMPKDRLTLDKLKRTLAAGSAATNFLLAYDYLIARKAISKVIQEPIGCSKNVRRLIWGLLPNHWHYTRLVRTQARKLRLRKNA